MYRTFAILSPPLICPKFSFYIMSLGCIWKHDFEFGFDLKRLDFKFIDFRYHFKSKDLDLDLKSKSLIF